MTDSENHSKERSRWIQAAKISNIGLWDICLGGGSCYFANEWYELRGLPADANVTLKQGYKAWVSRLHPDDRAGILEIVRQLRAGEKCTVSLEFRELHSVNGYIWISSRGKVVDWDESGRPKRFLGTDIDVTQIKHGEKINATLQNEQVRYQTAVESAGLGTWDVDRRRNVRYHSTTWKTMRGHSRSSDYGNNIEDVWADVHPEDMPNIKQQSNAFLSGQYNGTLSAQYRQRRKDGSWMWVLSRGRVVERDDAGISTREIGIDTDISTIKRNEAKLSQLSSTLELAVSAAEMGVWQSYSDTGNAIWDDRTLEIFGLPRDTGPITPEHFKSFVHPEDVAIVEEECDRPAELHQDFGSKFRIINPKLGVRHVEVQAKYNGSNEGGPRHVGVIFDMTNRVQRQEELSKTNRTLDTVLQHMEQGVAFFQGETLRSSKAVLLNDQFIDLLDLDPKYVSPELCFADYADRIRPYIKSPKLESADLEQVIDMAETGNALNTLLQFPSGRVLSVTGRSLSHGTRIVTLTDMTEVFQSERRLSEMADSISHLERLQALGQLTGGIAHDFNNLLSVILGNAELINLSMDNHEEVVSNIIQAANRGADLTQRLLAFARKQPLEPKAIDVASLFKNINSFLTRTLGEEIELKTFYNDGVWPVEADVRQLENVLVNLALNARDAMPNGGKLNISAENVHPENSDIQARYDIPPGDYVKFCVSDTGTGMDAATLEQAFNPFFTTKALGQGSGLGLSMVFGFVKQSGGGLKLFSQPNDGTKVKFLIPRSTQDVVIAGPERTEGTARGKGNLVLVVEDDESVRKMTITILRQLNYQVVAFDSARPAFNAIEHGRVDPDLVLSDVSLPGEMNGFQLGELIRKVRPELPIVFMSGYSDELLPTDSSALDISDIIQKPFSINELARRVSSEVLNKTHNAPA